MLIVNLINCWIWVTLFKSRPSQKFINFFEASSKKFKVVTGTAELSDLVERAGVRESECLSEL